MRPAARLALLALVLLAALVLAVRTGAVPLSTGAVLDGVLGIGDTATVAIVRDLRLPRSVLAALVGAALAASGATFQALLRNPLAEPYILGVSGGAAVGAVTLIVLGAGSEPWSLPLAAFAGALLAIGLVLRIAAAAGRALNTVTLLLAGVAAGAFFNACILLALAFAEAETFRSAVLWMMGSLSGATWDASGILVLYLVPGLVVLLALARPLNLLAIGEDTAAHLGVRVERVKLLAYATASLLAAAAVAVSGVIGFVGLVVPHAVRLLWGSDHRFLLPAATLLGAAFLVLADAAARTVAAPTELPVGVVTAFVGVPVFVWLLRRDAAGFRRPSSVLRRPSTPTPSPRHPVTPSPAHAVWFAESLTYRHPGADHDAVSGVELRVQAAACTAVLGPNGSGKSTLLRLLLGRIRPDVGGVVFQGREIGAWPRADLARLIGVVPQLEEITFPLSVRELVAMGRYPHLGSWRREGDEDRDAIELAMRRCEVLGLADRFVSTLSGGERQRARIARALAQEPEILALDEPTAALDIRHEMEIMELLRDLCDRGATVLLATHNLNLAARYSDAVILLSDGRVAAGGPPSSVLTRARVEDVYGWPVRVAPFAGPGRGAGEPEVTPVGRGERVNG